MKSLVMETANTSAKTITLLVVEDNIADADLVEELLDLAEPGAYHAVHAVCIKEALRKLREIAVQLVLLDLRLPDGVGVEAVKTLRSAVGPETPIVVVTGVEDESLALPCIEAGAQDYLRKRDMSPISLRRAIGYALSRLRMTQIQELQETLENYRALTSTAAGTTITAALSGTGAVSERYPAVFQELVSNYHQVLHLYLEQLILKKDKPKYQMERLITQLGDAGGGPRDLLDVHVAALDNAIRGRETERAKALVVEGRLLALEMMGLLVDYYRVGNRRFV